MTEVGRRSTIDQPFLIERKSESRNSLAEFRYKNMSANLIRKY